MRNTGKVAMAAGAAVVTVDLADVMDDAVLGNLPSGATIDGTTLTWNVPATALGATTTATLPVFVPPGTAVGSTLSATEAITTLGGTCLTCSSSVRVGTAPISPAPLPTITGGIPTTGATLTADTDRLGRRHVVRLPVAHRRHPRARRDLRDLRRHRRRGRPGRDRAGHRRSRGLRQDHPDQRPDRRRRPGHPAVTTPTISGTPKIGVPLTVAPGTWRPARSSPTPWRANGTPITGATGPRTPRPSPPRWARPSTVDVIGTKFGYTTTTRTSAATTAVAAGDPLVSTPTPAVSGTPKVGVAFAPDYGSWDDGTTLTFQWRANGTTISGATTGSFVPTATQLGQTLDVVVTGTRPGITPVVRTSNASAAVEPGTQVLQPTPTITGTVRPGLVVTGVPGTWDTGTTRTYKWYVGGIEVPLAVTTTFVPGVLDIGKALTFEVTSTRPGYTPVTRSSAASTVLGLPQVLTPTPTILGTPKVGLPLVAVPGAWDLGTTLSYQWLADGDAIDGATSLTYVPGVGQLGSRLAVRVASTKQDTETVVRTSDLTDAIAKGDLTDTPLPAITGTPRVGVPLQAVPGTWDDGVDLGYQWFADGDAISGATASTYVPGPNRVGAVITVAVTGVKTGYQTVVRTSAATSAVLSGDLTDAPVPTITGTPKVGTQLTAVPGAWDAGTTFGFQWFADGDAIAGATASTFTPDAAQQGDVVTVEVTGTLAGFLPVTTISLPTAPVALGDLVTTPVPTVTGTPKVGVATVAVPGTWDAGTALGFQWLADGVAVAGATASSFTPGAAQQGRALTVAVTGTRTGFLPVTQVSLPTAAVALGDLLATPVPSIGGTPKVDAVLTALPGAWDTGAALAYQWSVADVPVAGATGSTYVVRASDAGRALTVAVTGTLAGYVPATRTSSPSPTVAAGDLASAPTPTVVGTPTVDRELRADPGAWDAGTAFDYRWTRDGVAIPGASDATYRASAADLGRTIAVVVTGSKVGYSSLSRASAGAVVSAATQVLRPKPAVVGRARVGKVLKARPGTYDAGVTLTYLWQAGTRKVGTGRTLVLRTKLRGTRIVLTVTATRPGYTTVVARSARTGKVQPR